MGKYWEAGAVKALRVEENCLIILDLLGASREQVGVHVGHGDMAVLTAMALEIEAHHEKGWPSWTEQLADWRLQFVRSSTGWGKWQPDENAERRSEPRVMKQTAPGTVGAY